MTKESKKLNWAGALARLQSIQESLDRGETSIDVSRIFNERAVRLAQSEPILEDLKAAGILMIFRLGGERYAFPISEVTEVLPEFKLAPVPGAPPAVAGVIQVRGDIRPIYDLRRLLGLEKRESENRGVVILMRTNAGPLGVRVDSVDEIRPVTKEDRRVQGYAGLIAWLTDDLVSVLNTGLLWRKES